GAGLTISPTQEIAVDPAQVQQRLAASCAMGYALVGIAQDGSALCTRLPVTRTYTGALGSQGYSAGEAFQEIADLDDIELTGDFDTLIVTYSDVVISTTGGCWFQIRVGGIEPQNTTQFYLTNTSGWTPVTTPFVFDVSSLAPGTHTVDLWMRSQSSSLANCTVFGSYTLVAQEL
ncbi:MAG: hypothetical protein AAF658_21100, partial [Myxococcota bacterium]